MNSQDHWRVAGVFPGQGPQYEGGDIEDGAADVLGLRHRNSLHQMSWKCTTDKSNKTELTY